MPLSCLCVLMMALLCNEDIYSENSYCVKDRNWWKIVKIKIYKCCIKKKSNFDWPETSFFPWPNRSYSSQCPVLSVMIIIVIILLISPNTGPCLLAALSISGNAQQQSTPPSQAPPPQPATRTTNHRSSNAGTNKKKSIQWVTCTVRPQLWGGRGSLTLVMWAVCT